MSSGTSHPINCPRFDSCSATKCPLDPQVHSRTYLPGDRVCFYMQLAAKELLTPENLYGLSGEQVEAVGKYTENVKSPMSHSEKGLWELKTQLSRMAQTPIRELKLATTG